MARISRLCGLAIVSALSIPGGATLASPPNAAPAPAYSGPVPASAATPPASPATSPASPPPVPSSVARAQRVWLLASDFHFNPFDDPTLVGRLARAPVAQWRDIFEAAHASPSPYFKDTNYALFAASLVAMRARIPAPPVVVIAGDFLAHHLPEQFKAALPAEPDTTYRTLVDKTIEFIAAELDATYPRAQFIVTIGNNDGYCGDYHSTPDDAFLAHMARAWAPLVDRNGAAPNFVRDFSHGGYYSATLPSAAPAQAVVLNSVFWSAKYANACGIAGSDPGAEELAWFATTAKSSPGAYRWLVAHIPPQVDQFVSLLAQKPVPFLHEDALLRLVNIADDPTTKASAFVLGHGHHAAFEIVGPGDGTGVPGLLVPSISPVQGNNPGFVAATVEEATGTIVDTTTFAYSLGAPNAAWSDAYSFDAAYALQGFDTSNLRKLDAALFADAALRATYAKHYNLESTVAPVPWTAWPWYFCGELRLTSAAYGACVRDHGAQPPPVRTSLSSFGQRVS